MKSIRSRGWINAKDPNVLALIILANAAMTINQSNISAMYFLISSEFHESVYGLGILVALFFLSYGLFEIPGALMATRLGAKRVLLIGVTINAASVIGSSFSEQFVVLAFFRFFAGLGFAFAFPSIVILTTRSLRQGSEGLSVGLIFLSSTISSATGIFGWSILVQFIGWRLATFTSGSLDLVPLVLVPFFLASDTDFGVLTFDKSAFRNTIFNKPLILLSVSQFGMGTTIGIIYNFLVFYLEQNFHIAPTLAGLMGGVIPLFTIFMGPTIGKFYDRAGNPKRILLIFSGCMSFGMWLVSFNTVVLTIIGAVVAGLSIGAGPTIALAVAKKMAIRENFENLSVALADSASLFGVFASPLYFSTVALNLGYPFAWVVCAFPPFLLTLPFVFHKINEH